MFRPPAANSQIGGNLHGDFYQTGIDNMKIALYHGTYPGITQSLEKSGDYDVVISGHTHEPKLDTIGSTLSINPGSAHGFDGEAMIAILDTTTRQVKFIEL
ncbi:MAG: metallophosphoesterase family protein [Balneolaceae bacterium]